MLFGIAITIKLGEFVKANNHGEYKEHQTSLCEALYTSAFCEILLLTEP